LKKIKDESEKLFPCELYKKMAGRRSWRSRVKEIFMAERVVLNLMSKMEIIYAGQIILR